MTAMVELGAKGLADLVNDLQRQYKLISGNRLSLDLSRGKPAADQLALSDDIESTINDNFLAEDGSDARNYGGLRGLSEARELGAEILGVPASQVLAGGNSSLSLMHLVLSTALHKGLWQDERNWSAGGDPSIITPVPGYDRHYTLSEALGIAMVTIPMGDEGPDFESVWSLVEDKPNIKGIWCVPKYSNPTGYIYSNAVVEGLAQTPNKAAADDFVVLWDNAYAVHDLTFPPQKLASIYEASLKCGTEDHIVQFTSTSKITFAGAGVAFLASGSRVLDALEAELAFQTIGPDKVNQLRHARYLRGRIETHMRAHAELLKPKFNIVLETLEANLGELGIAEWTRPNGGYFVSVDVTPGLATRVIELARDVGLSLTPAGATFPYGNDPLDRNIRIAPTFADLEELSESMQVLTLCIKLATAQSLVGNI